MARFKKLKLKTSLHDPGNFQWTVEGKTDVLPAYRNRVIGKTKNAELAVNYFLDTESNMTIEAAFALMREYLCVQIQGIRDYVQIEADRVSRVYQQAGALTLESFNNN